MKIVYLLLLALFVQGASAQQSKRKLEEKVIKGWEYHSTFGADVSPAMAKSRVLQLAKLDAIGQNLGTVVTQNSMTVLKDQKLDFSSFGECDVRGEWIETIGEPEWTVTSDGRNYNYKVRISGRIREWNSSAVDIDARLLCNGSDTLRNKLRFNTYVHKDSLMVYFRTPAEGYVAIFGVDEGDSKVVSRLLPYYGQRDLAYHVDADRDYYFFSREKAPAADRRYKRLRLQMLCDSESEELWQLYIVFSTQPFQRPNDVTVDNEHPNQLDFQTFHKWLAKHRSKDRNMVVKKEIVKIVRQ